MVTREMRKRRRNCNTLILRLVLWNLSVWNVTPVELLNGFLILWKQLFKNGSGLPFSLINGFLYFSFLTIAPVGYGAPVFLWVFFLIDLLVVKRLVSDTCGTGILLTRNFFQIPLFLTASISHSEDDEDDYHAHCNHA